jgi:hypothetical protein
MIVDRTARLGWGLALAAFALGACSGSVGSGAPMTPPGPQGQQYGVQPNNAPQSRQQIAENVTPIGKDDATVAIAALGGFTVKMDISKPSPPPAASGANTSPRATPKPTPKPTPTPSPTPSPSPSPTPGSWKGKPTPTPTPSGPRITAKITIYPDGTQKPPGDADAEQARRVPVVDVLLDPSVDVALYSLGAFSFSIPKTEQEEDRGFTVALYETRKFHKDSLIDSQVDATVDGGVVRAAHAKDAHKLSAGHSYTVILFGDPLPQTPSPYSPPQYPGSQMQYSPQVPQQPQVPGQQQPFFTPIPFPGQPGQPGYGAPTPYPSPTHY